MAIIGIDLGTTNSLVSIWRNNKVELIPNSFGNVLTPSVVSVDENGNIYVGEVAKERLISNPEMTIASFKKFMGTNKRITLDNNIFTPEELSALILKRLKKDAENYLGEEVEEAIISVPAYFNDEQRQATKNAGKIAGLKVERLVNEPSAAALAGRTLFNKNETTMLIVDIGGGTCDISLVECFDNVVSVVAVSGDNNLGGNNFDEVIAKYFCYKNSIDYNKLSSEAKGILLKNAELCKLKLSFEETATIDLNLTNIKGNLILTRQEFVQLSSELFFKIKKVIQRVLIDGDFEKDEIEDIVLVGGCCKTYIIQKFIQHLFDKIPLYVGEPNEIVGMGVGIYAGIKARDEDIKEVLLTDICPFSLGVEVFNRENNYEGGLFSPIIERNTVLPTSQSEFYIKAYPEQDKIILSIYQGENRLVKDNLKLGEILIPMPKDIEGNIKVTFTYDINGILEVETEIIELKEKIVNVILSDNNKRLSEEEIQQKIAKMKNVKIESADKEKIEYLVSLGNSLYSQTVGNLRSKIDIETGKFLTNIKTKNRQKRLEFIEQFSKFLNDISNIIGQNLDNNLNFNLNNYWYFDFRDKE